MIPLVAGSITDHSEADAGSQWSCAGPGAASGGGMASWSLQEVGGWLDGFDVRCERKNDQK